MNKNLLIAFLLFFTLIAYEAQAVEFTAHGYYRLRFEYTHDLDLQTPNPGITDGDTSGDDNDRFGAIAFAQQRLRIQPILKLNNHISIHSEIDLLDNLLFGQSDVNPLKISNPITGDLILPEANGAFGVLGSSAGATVGSGGGNINVRQVYVDIFTAGGKFRIGRQASHFGLGILSNDGGGREGDFGDIYDRFTYLAGVSLKNGHRVNFGIAFDMAYEATLDPSISGLDRGVDSNWNDAFQIGAVGLYQTDNWEIGILGAFRFRDGDDGQPTTTARRIVRNEDENGNVTFTPEYVPAGKDGDTGVFVLDAYGRFNIARNYRFGFETAFIFGKISTGVALDAPDLIDNSINPITDPIELPLIGNQNDVFVFLAAAELEAWWDFGGEVKVQAGFASGDSSPLSSTITQIGFRPDYDLGILLFDVPLGSSPAIRANGDSFFGRKSVTPNYINNAAYFAFGYKHNINVKGGIPFAEDVKLGAKVITAVAPSRNLDIDLAEITGVDTLPRIVNESKWYGFEFDVSLEATLYEFMHFKTIAGVFIPGGIFDIKNDDIDAVVNAGIITPILPDGAEPAFAWKTTLTFEF